MLWLSDLNGNICAIGQHVESGGTGDSLFNDAGQGLGRRIALDLDHRADILKSVAHGLVDTEHQTRRLHRRGGNSTGDQQGQIAMNQKDYAAASTLFQDPYHRGYAQLKAGQYAEASETFAQLSTPEAAFAEGMALAKRILVERGDHFLLEKDDHSILDLRFCYRAESW